MVAAHYVDAEEKGIWRAALIEHLGDVNDIDAYFPVMALGVSVWALAQTGAGLDTTPVDENAPSTSPWYQKTLADLPGILLGHQVTATPYAGSFYWRFDHAGDPAGRYTEDTVYGTLGLMAADEGGFADCDGAIADARAALALGVAVDGTVYEHIWGTDMPLHLWAGETLQALVCEGGVILTDLREDSLAVPEGGTASFGVALSAQPTADVVVTVTHDGGDGDITVQSGATLTFTPTNWATYQPVTLAAAEDDDSTSGVATIRCEAEGWSYVLVTAVEEENEAPVLGISVAPGSWPIAGVQPPGAVCATAQDTRLTVTNTGNVSETLRLRIADEDDQDT